MQFVLIGLLVGCCSLVNSYPSIATDVAEVDHNNNKSFDEEFNLNFELSNDDLKRVKRSDLGSGGFLSGIGNVIFGKVAEASSASSGSLTGSHGDAHNFETVEYGAPVYGHSDDHNFDIWSFKKAILNTLFQALKAIGGGVIALKGKLIQGGGVLISAKGKIVSAKGQAISTLGRNIASTAILTPPKLSYGGGHGYGYSHPPIGQIHVTAGHDSYVGPTPHDSYDNHGHGYVPPSGPSDSYGHSGYASPSEVVFSYAYYPNLRSDGSVQYQPVQHPYQNYYNNQ